MLLKINHARYKPNISAISFIIIFCGFKFSGLINQTQFLFIFICKTDSIFRPKSNVGQHKHKYGAFYQA